MSDWTQHHQHATPSADCHLCPKAQAMSTKEPTLAELIVNMRERGLDYCLANHDTDCMCGPAMQLTSDKISAFHVRVNALAEKWEREALPLPDDPRRISESAGFNYAKRLCAAELRKLTGDLPSRDKQQGEPEICRESVTIPMVQEVYGSQPQIRAGIGPTEPVRPMSEPTQESMERTSQLLDRIFTAYYSGKEAKSFRHSFRRDVASMIATEFDRLSDYVRSQVEAGRLEEAKWWEHLVGAVQPNHPEGFDPDCMYCRRIAAIRARKDGSACLYSLTGLMSLLKDRRKK